MVKVYSFATRWRAAIVADIVRRHKGHLALEDRDGGGLSVRVTLPAAVAT